MSNSLQPRELQHARLPCPSVSPGVCSNSCPLCQWCHPTISSSPAPFSSCPQFPQHQVLFQWVSSLHQVARVLELQHHSFRWIFRVDFFRINWLDLPVVQGILKSLLQHHSLKALVLRHLAFFVVQLSHPYMTTGKTTALTVWTFVSKVMSLLFNTLSRSKHLLISLLSSPSTVILETSRCFYFFPCYLPLMYCWVNKAV